MVVNFGLEDGMATADVVSSTSVDDGTVKVFDEALLLLATDLTIDRFFSS